MTTPLTALLLAIPLILIASDAGPPVVSPPSIGLRKAFDLDPHYKKSLIVSDFPIVASAEVSDAAIQEAANVRADDPSRQNEPHLRNLDRESLKPFAWTKEEQAAFDALERAK